jgi:hypothetical protein
MLVELCSVAADGQFTDRSGSLQLPLLSSRPALRLATIRYRQQRIVSTMEDHRKQLRDQINALVSKELTLPRAEIAESNKSNRLKQDQRSKRNSQVRLSTMVFRNTVPYEEFQKLLCECRCKDIDVIVYKISDYLFGTC